MDAEGGENADVPEVETIASARSPLNRLRGFLPRGDTLPAAVWEKRHRFLVALLGVNALALPIFGIALGYSVVHSVLEGGVIPGAVALAALLIPGSRKIRAGLVTLGLLSCAAMLTHFSGGYIEAHFYFFIVVVIIGLYEDWLPFGLALAYVVLHHGIGGAIDPASVYNHPAAQEHPWRWAAIHGTGISLAAALSIGTWKLNEELRAERLAASRAHLVAAADQTRRRIERDLHDGAQQQLVSLAVTLRSAEATVPPELHELRTQVSQVADGLKDVLAELRELSRGMHPAILSHGGLGPALRTLARRSPIPVSLELHCDRRLTEGVEVAAYYVVAEALTNVVKHADAGTARVKAVVDDGALHVEVRDDGVGGADRRRGTGLVGLADRVAVNGGTIGITSPPGEGTTIVAELPIEHEWPADRPVASVAG